MKYVPFKYYKAVATGLKAMYQSATEEEAQQALARFGEQWDSKYPQISRFWHYNWPI